MVGRMRTIEGERCVAEGAAWLAAREPRFAKALEAAAPLALRSAPGGFDQLLRAIVGQQVSVASARAVWGRLEAAGLTSESAVLAAPDEALRLAGLSRQKTRYARALAAEGVDYAALPGLPTEEVVRRLVRVPGIGVWTAEIYAMFALGRADAFAAGDMALQEGARLLFELPERPKEGPLRRMAEAWSPWRGVAARILWGHYHVAKAREGVL